MHALLGVAAPNLQGGLAAILAESGCAVDVAPTAADTMRGLAAAPGPDVLLLGLDLPDIDGLTVCELVRRQSAIPILLIGHHESLADRVNGLTRGADDFLTWPIHPAELAARMLAVSRRCGILGDPTGQIRTTIDVGPVHLDVGQRQVDVDGIPKALTRKEFDVLSVLCSRPGGTVGRDQLIRRVWRRNQPGLEHTLQTHVTSLRSKLGVHNLIRTVRGVGYRVEVPPPDGDAG